MQTDLSLDDLIQFADHHRAMICVLNREYLRVLVLLDTEDNYVPDGSTSLGRWLAGRHAMRTGAADETVRVAHALERLPAIAAAYANAELSWDQTRMLARYATAETDQQLARDGCRLSVAWLEREAARHQPRPEPKTQQRTLDIRPDGEGWRVHGWVPGTDGEKIATAIDRIANGYGTNPDTGVFDPIWMRRADALTELAAGRLANDHDADRATVVIHYDTDTARAETASGIQLPNETFQRHCCDARIETIRWSGVNIVEAAAAKHAIPIWLRRVVLRRDNGCRFHGCGHKRRVEVHHIHHWLHGGPTVVTNLITLCTYHHHLLHERGWRITGEPSGPVEFVRPDTGTALTNAPPGLPALLADALAKHLNRLGY